MFRYVFLIFLFFSHSSFSYWANAANALYPTLESACVSSAGIYVGSYGSDMSKYSYRQASQYIGYCTVVLQSGNVLDYVISNYSAGCPQGQIEVSGQCQSDVITCPPNQIRLTTNGVQSCSDFTDDEQCKNSWDYYINANCAKQKEDCVAGGGSHGWVDGKSTCIPSDFLDDQPVCAGDFTVVDNGNGSGGVVCTPAGTPQPPINPPTNPDAPPPVTGGDNPANHNGIGDNSNGDGPAGSGAETTTCKSNSSLSANDPACVETETKNNNASAGGSGCSAPPSCSGDPIMCNILKQEYENKCANNTFDPSALGNLAGVDQISTSSNIGETFDGIFVDDGQTSSCPSPRTLSFVNQTFSFAPVCSVMEQLRPLVIMLFAFFAARLVHKTLLEV